ncbi:hypothetical protein [Kibdelosporangium philippinense]|uniref:hypothetical protein n=1 Tax=Kibdelosporangium philippinense TaxID=211113 RepID=UPI00360A2BF0
MSRAIRPSYACIQVVERPAQIDSQLDSIPVRVQLTLIHEQLIGDHIDYTGVNVHTRIAIDENTARTVIGHDDFLRLGNLVRQSVAVRLDADHFFFPRLDVGDIAWPVGRTTSHRPSSVDMSSSVDLPSDMSSSTDMLPAEDFAGDCPIDGPTSPWPTFRGLS